ncbi:MAG: DNA recombination protein RmuC [Kangiellaceae bacterium]|jgi:DNA recombination protein RmuC
MEVLLQSVPELVLANSVVLIVLLILLFRLQSSSVEQKLLDDNAQQVEVIKQLINENQRNLDDKVSRSQTQLFEMISADREKQLASLEDLKLTLEKRFANSESALSNNIQSFKVDMVERFEQLKRNTGQSLQSGQEQLAATVAGFGEKITERMQAHQTATSQLISENIRKGIQDLRQDLDRSLIKQSEVTSKSIAGLTESTDNRLKEISGQVEKRLTDGFEKTNQTFNDVIKRLALIDDAQKKITELSSNVVSLQEILNDKRSRGAFGEVQLQSLVSNIMPDSHYSMQSKLSNDKIADCVLVLPEPTGKIAIDAKFPLESYKRMTDLEVAKVDRKEANKQFARDIKKHINDIASKYVLPPETSDGAVMFIPAESVFAEIHGHYPELVEYAYQSKVWMVSPTTLMAILTTASAVIKDEQTRKQVHIIKEHLSALGKDFGRFQGRMDKLSSHIGQVSKDVDLVHTSAKKISSRFEKIERVDLSVEQQPGLVEDLNDKQ